jgi:spore coat protein CotH
MKSSASASAILVLLTIASVPAQTPAPPTLTADDLFDTNTVQDLQLTVHSRDWAELRQHYRENIYYVADLRWRGEVVRNIGIRSRGAGSRSFAKPGLRLDFDRYASSQEFLGLKSLVLDNLTQDPSMVKERIVMRFFNEMGIPAPRVVHARLFVNNEFLGLYTIVESIDKGFLKRNFNENDGYLYEFHYTDRYGLEYLGSELERYARFFEPKTHERDSMAALYRPIREMAWAISESPPSMFVSAVGEYLDVRTFLTYIAVENFLADRDGLLGEWGVNNFYLYRFEGKNLSQLVPWDKDSSFWAVNYNIWTNMEANAFTRRAIEERPLQLIYVEALRRCAELALRPPEPAPEPGPESQRGRYADAPTEPGWLERQVTFMHSQIRAVADVDEKKPFTSERFEDEMGKVLEFSRARAKYVLHESKSSYQPIGR